MAEKAAAAESSRRSAPWTDKAFTEATQAGSIAAYEAYIRNNAAGGASDRKRRGASRNSARTSDVKQQRLRCETAAKPTRPAQFGDAGRPMCRQRPAYKAPPLQRVCARHLTPSLAFLPDLVERLREALQRIGVGRRWCRARRCPLPPRRCRDAALSTSCVFVSGVLDPRAVVLGVHGELAARDIERGIRRPA